MKLLVLIPFKENVTQSIRFYLLPKILSQVFVKLSPHWRNFFVMSTPNQDRLCFNSRQNNFFCKLPPLWQCLFTETVKCYNVPFYCSVVQIYTSSIKLYCFVSLIFLWKKNVLPSNYYCCLQKFLFFKKNYFYTEVILRTTE